MRSGFSAESGEKILDKSAHIIVFGNEKGGSGKSTLAMHVLTALLLDNKRVAVIDLDARQRSLSRYLENRAQYNRENFTSLAVPENITIAPSQAENLKDQVADEQQRIGEALGSLQDENNFILIDCPGSHTTLSRLAHALADTLVTPINDSFVDLDLIGQVHPDTGNIIRLSHYAEMVWDSRKYRAAGERDPIDWVVTRNRVANINSLNNQRVHDALTALQKRVRFRVVPGLNERVIYRELFPKGLTMMDLDQVPDFGKMQMSHVAARNEVRSLVRALNLTGS